MSFIAWIILGLVGLTAGFVASRIVNQTGDGAILDVLLGIAGAVLAGWFFRIFGMSGVTGHNLYSMLVATFGAAVVLIVYHAVFRDSRFQRV